MPISSQIREKTIGRTSYTSDLSDAQWELIASMLVLPERAGAKLVLTKADQSGLPRLETVLADDGYSGKPMREYVFDQHGWQFVSVKRTELHQFKVMPKRWVVERTIGWMNNFRGLSKHYDDHCKTGESKILFASVFYMTKRLTMTQATPKWDIENEVKFKNTIKISTN